MKYIKVTDEFWFKLNPIQVIFPFTYSEYVSVTSELCPHEFILNPNTGYIHGEGVMHVTLIEPSISFGIIKAKSVSYGKFCAKLPQKNKRSRDKSYIRLHLKEYPVRIICYHPSTLLGFSLRIGECEYWFKDGPENWKEAWNIIEANMDKKCKNIVQKIKKVMVDPWK